MTSAQETSPLLQNQHGTSNATTPTSGTSASHQRHQETKGLLYMTLSALFFSFMSLLVSLTAKTLPSFEIVLFRGIIQTLLGVIACRYLGISPLGQPDNRIRFLLFCRGLAGSFGLGFFFYALSVMPLADATVIFFFGPTFTAILGRIVLKEPFGPLDATASAITMCGVVLVSKPTFLFPPPSPPAPGPGESGQDMIAAFFVKQQEEDHRRLFGTLAGLCGAMCSAVIGKQGAHSMQHVTYFGVVSCFVSLIGLFTLQGGYVAPQGTWMWSGVVALGVSAFFGQVLLNSGLQLAPLGPGTLMRMNDIVFAFIFQITVQHEHPDLFSFLGASLVMICTGSMGLNKWRIEKKRVQQEKEQQDQDQQQQQP
ncbi:hypothetical protein KI688_003350 [Linnemannia hyalina]|uniref:EamA domain-containing protein n=1 Tax=Linnemannia hyalina TaxID=64524 RepID=A0A9P7XP81_9FUNG|nr:hypothetical protein KI688_003350 [Linnemannia hyalina]